jgi:anti-sigma factor RsiW
MSHLGQRLSALIDGELGAAERDRVLAHLARCDACRQEAVTLRALKQRMHSLGEAMVDTALTGRLMAMATAGEHGAGPRPWRPRAVYAAARWIAAGLTASVMAAVGAVAFFVGGEQDSGPKVTPAVDSFLVQHGSVTGDVPVAPPPAAAHGAAGAVSVVPGAAAGAVATAAATAATAASPPAGSRAAASRAVARRAAARPARASAAAPATRPARSARSSASASATRPVTPRNALLRPARRAAAGPLLAAASPGP